jgi:hypothetical protein
VGTTDRGFCERRPSPGDDLLMDMLRENWFASPAPLFRSSTVAPGFFDGKTKYYEWTLLAFGLLTAGRTFAFIDHAGFRLHDSPNSLSKNPAGILATPAFLRKLLSLQPPHHVQAALRRRLSGALHACSVMCLESGDRIAAWKFHLQSLMTPSGLAYLLYTRHLLNPFSPARK